MLGKMTNYPPRNVEGTLHGITNRGRVKLEVQGRQWLGEGRLFRILPGRLREGKLVPQRQHVHTMPNIPPAEGLKRHIPCRCARTGQPHLFYGYVRPRRQKQPVGADSSSMEPSKPHRQKARATTRASQPEKDATDADAAAQAIKAELEIIAAARASGLDPDLKIRHVCALTQLSRATIDRRINDRTFPPQIRYARGRGVFWRMSHIEAYLAGTWAPATD